jgi:hypothetical protein
MLIVRPAQRSDWGAALPSGAITSVAWSLSGKSVLCGCKGGDVLWVTKDGQQRKKWARPDDAFSPDDPIEGIHACSATNSRDGIGLTSSLFSCHTTRAAHQVMSLGDRLIGVAYRIVDQGEPTGDSMFYTMDLPKEVRSNRTNSSSSSSSSSSGE